jgi:signal transduction histidine kinase
MENGFPKGIASGASMARKVFIWNRPSTEPVVGARDADALHLSADVLARNADWSIQVRWIAGGLLLLYYFNSFLPPGAFRFVGIVSEGQWSLHLALFLLGCNLTFYAGSRSRLIRKWVRPIGHAWFQILADLLAITVVVHYCGSIGTPAPFLYILHIALACIFFSVQISLLVAVLSALLYGGCVVLEYSGLMAVHSVFVNGLHADPGLSLSFLAWNVVSVTGLFFLLWYMLSHLSKIIRVREAQLVTTMEEMRRLQVEKDRYAVQMTHQLKSPLDAIRSNIALVLNGYCGAVGQEVADMLARMDRRAHGLAVAVIDVLKLSRLNAPMNDARPEKLPLGALIEECIERYKTPAEQRGIRIEREISGAAIVGVKEHIDMLLDNLISNAITYSQSGGVVRVRCGQGPGGGAECTVADSGIGIPSEKLPFIFDEYFRTKEAIAHNASSTGIGLAIVKKVAQTYGIALTIDSERNQGTSITAQFPPPGQ